VAPPAGTLRVGRYFLALLAIIAVLYAIVFWPGQRHTPKLGLDLVGGTQVIFTAKTPTGHTPSGSQMSQAKQIMESRVNGTGVTQSTVVVQGSNQIVVTIPGVTSADTVRQLGKAAVLSMRGNVMPAVVALCPSASGTSVTTASPSPSAPASASVSASPTASIVPSGGASSSAGAHPLVEGVHVAAPTTPAGSTPPASGAATGSATGSASGSPSGSPSGSAASSPTTAQCKDNPLASLGFAVPTTDAEYGKLTATQQQSLQTALSAVNCNNTSAQPDTAKYFIACEPSTGLVFLLGPAIVHGTQIAGASAQAPNTSQGQFQWTVNLNLKSSGQAAWSSYTGAHNIGGSSAQSSPVTQCGAGGTPCADFVGFVLDGSVISAPVNESAINGQTTQITGSFTQKSANQLANQLKYGALPLSFTAQDAQTVSASLGTSQLKAGMLAGGIGLILVVLYSLVYYRALGLVTIASLLVSGALTYGSLVMLATQIGFTLSLAGIAGFIVAVGITADSFVVFFERIKDEVHEGRSARVAIPRAWTRARRTILSADTVSFLAAAILYYFAAGDVKGFAFTLGLSTILDLVVVFLFTHPLVSLLSRLRTFGSRRFTGLDAIRGGPALPDEPARTPTSKPRRPQRSRPRPARDADRPDAAAQRPASARPASTAVAEPQTEVPQAGVPQAEAPQSEPRPPADPVPGSAAERAAARRARMREQKGKQ
jgi:preprotein translocase subunit SecD